MTDLLLLEIMRHRFHGAASTIVLVRGKTPKHLEKLYGTDWEWWIGSETRGWNRYALQAKMIDLETERYNGLGHHVAGVPQVDLLEKYAARVGAIPLYVFYNYSNSLLPTPGGCCGGAPLRQFGCSITPSANVQAALRKRGARNFTSVHSLPNSVPWRCLVACPRMQGSSLHPLASENSRHWYSQPPAFYARKTTPKLNERGDSNVEYWPKGVRPSRLMITTLYEERGNES